MSKKLLAGAVALCLAVPSTFAAWDYFPVIEQGSAEVNVGFQGVSYVDEEMTVQLPSAKIRYGLIDNLEVFAASSAANCATYTIGARYQIMPEMLSAYLDLGIPSNYQAQDFGLTPGVQFSTNFTETISLGVGVGLPLHINHPGWAEKAEDNNPRADGFGLDLAAGLELDVKLSEQVLFWVGVDFNYVDLTSAEYQGKNPDGSDKKRPDFEVTEKDVLVPAIGFTFSKDNLSVGTKLALDLSASTDKQQSDFDTGKDEERKTSIGLVGGIDFTIKF